ncbi:hypothetical protein XELAEV_18013615mg [Xenopus laevis]|uniref:IF rod domain-containing protein n=1 Tax=Xenopus laevis TaxID=8355 RepID=A0A974HZT2_XENLA|nr:hypothetical protein XELAEV_18013615mg [Xenopus laevis]
MSFNQISCKKRPTVSSGSGGGGYWTKGLSSHSKFRGNMKFPVCPPGGIQQVTINSQLLLPLDLAIDPTIQKVKAEEREQIKTLNNTFATLLDKVRFMEQQNKVLETKWKLLQEQGTKGTTKSANLDPLFEKYIADQKRYLDNLINGKSRLQHELKNMHDRVEQYRKKFGDEINNRTKAENDSVVFKKDVDAACTVNIELEAEVDALTSKIDFLTNLYAVELSQVHDQVNDTSVLTMDNDLYSLINEAEYQYEQIAQRSKLEAEALFHNQYKELQKTVEGNSTILKNSKTQIADLNSKIRKLKAEIENVKKQITALNQSIDGKKKRGNLALEDAEKKLKDLEDAENKLTEYMAHQLKEYQELLSYKLTQDFVVATYRKMLEGEEGRSLHSAEIQVYTAKWELQVAWEMEWDQDTVVGMAMEVMVVPCTEEVHSNLEREI